MSRVVRLLATWLAGLAVVTAILAGAIGRRALETGRVLYAHRVVLQSLAAGAVEPSPAVVWLGDSSIMGTAALPSYPSRIDVGRLRPRGLHGLTLAAMGFDFYAHHSLIDDVLDLHPRLVVMIANFRVSIPDGGVRGFNDLTAELPLATLPQMLVLPYSFRGMTAPRLLLARALRAQEGEAGFLVVEGGRRWFQERPFWTPAGPLEPHVPTAWELFTTGRNRVLADYRQPVRRGHPLMRFAGAAVARAVERGARVLVVVTPVPVERLRALGWYDPTDFAHRVAVVRDVVEGAGGAVLDLHDALPESLFRDAGGHFNDVGTDRMVELVWPAMAGALGEPVDLVAVPRGR